MDTWSKYNDVSWKCDFIFIASIFEVISDPHGTDKMKSPRNYAVHISLSTIRTSRVRTAIGKWI